MAEDTVVEDNVEQAEGPDFMSMSDAEIAALDPNTLEAPEAPQPDEYSEEAEPENEEESASDSEEGVDDTDSTDDTDDDNTADSTEEGEPQSDEQKQAATLKEFYDQLTAPFKANGHDMQIKSADEAIRLMKMGAGFNKKMQGLKPNLKLMRMLDANKLLNEEKLSFLIDLDKKDPKAIAKLLKDSGVDPLDLNVEEETSYQPGNYALDDKQLALEEVADELKDSATYDQLLDVVVNKWDGASQEVIRDQPQLLNVINDHMANGIYDVITVEMNRQQALGQLSGMSNIQAYRHVGDAIQERGGFDHLFQQKQSPAPNDPTPAAQKQQKASDDAGRNSRRRAASPTRKTPAAKKLPGDFNPLAMSDEEFMKLDPNLM